MTEHGGPHITLWSPDAKRTLVIFFDIGHIFNLNMKLDSQSF